MSEIAVNAGVSKALLFHYFGTKKALYRYLFRLAYDELLAEMGTGTEDFFENMRLAIDVKIRFVAQHPEMLSFLTSMVKEQNGEVAAEVTAIRKALAEQSTGTFLSNVDWGRFRSDIDQSTVWNLVMWVSEGYINANLDLKSIDELVGEVNRYMNIIKRAVYKEEYL
jgi:AcrR family transcriptional regulator